MIEVSKRTMLISVIVVCLAAAGLFIGVAVSGRSGAVADSNSTDVGQTSGCGRGQGPMGGGALCGSLDETHAEVAKALGISVEELEKELSAGKNCAEIAESKGLSAEKFAEIVNKVKTDAIDKAVAEGKMTTEQAEWMKSRIANCSGNGAGAGRCNSGGSGCGGACHDKN